MAIPREQAFGVFEDLLGQGLRPVLTGFRSQNDTSQYWPKGAEGFFVYAHFSSIQRLGFLITDIQAMHDTAERHGLKAWFSGRERDYDSAEYDGSHHEFRVSFESA